MQVFPDASKVFIDIPLDGVGGALSLQWRLVGKSGAQIIGWATEVIAQPPAATLRVASLAAQNTITAPAIRELRSLEVRITTSGNDRTFSIEYMLQASDALALGADSFQTYLEAMMLSGDFFGPKIASWDAASRSDRERALRQSYARVLRLPVYASWHPNLRGGTIPMAALFESAALNSFIFEERYSRPLPLADMKPAEYLALDPKLLAALRRAQLIEASHLLQMTAQEASGAGLGSLSEAVAAGMTSLTVGESSQTFGSSGAAKSSSIAAYKAMGLHVSPDALSELTAWISYRAVVARG